VAKADSLPASVPSARLLGADKLIKLQDRSILLLSVSLQVVIALLFGHQYDMRIFMATGYLVGTGQNPYLAQDLSQIFHSVAFRGMTSTGYPPPWALVLGVIYRMVYTAVPNLLVYNLAIKIPIIAANICLAYLVAHILINMGASRADSRRAWIFLLLNPLLLYFGSAWGQFDSIVACLALLSIVFLYKEHLDLSAMILALSVSFKPTSLPILFVALFYLAGKKYQGVLRYFGVFLLSTFLFSIFPFILFKWDPSVIFAHWNAHFTVGGGMSFMTFLELLRDSYQLPGQWWLLGMIWLPALLIAMLFLKPGRQSFVDLLKKSTAFLLIFFLTRAWLSEQNVVLILPFVLILTTIGELNPLALAGTWILPLIFTVFNTSPPQLLYLNFPVAMLHLLRLADQFREARLLTRTLLVIPWQIVGWWIVITCLKRPTAQTDSQLINRDLTTEGLAQWK
jgi:hypothetical protein